MIIILLFLHLENEYTIFYQGLLLQSAVYTKGDNPTLKEFKWLEKIIGLHMEINRINFGKM